MKRIVIAMLIAIMLIPTMVSANVELLWVENQTLSVGEKNTISWLPYLFDKDTYINIYLCMESTGYGKAINKVVIGRNLKGITSYDFILEYYDLKILSRERDILNCDYYFLLEEPGKLVYATQKCNVLNMNHDLEIHSPGNQRHIVLDWFTNGFDIVWNPGEYPKSARVGISIYRDDMHMHIVNTDNIGIHRYIPNRKKIKETFGDKLFFDDLEVRLYVYEMKPNAKGEVYEYVEEKNISIREKNILNVISPNGGEELKTGIIPITWEATAVPFAPDNKIEIWLIGEKSKNNVSFSVLLTTEINDGSCYIELTEEHLYSGNDKYNVLIINKSIETSPGQFISDFSDMAFEIKKGD